MVKQIKLELLAARLTEKRPNQWEFSTDKRHIYRGTEGGTWHTWSRYSATFDGFQFIVEQDFKKHWYRTHDMLDNPEIEEWQSYEYRLRVLDKGNQIVRFDNSEAIERIFNSVDKKFKEYQKQKIKKQEKEAFSRLKRALQNEQ